MHYFLVYTSRKTQSLIDLFVSYRIHSCTYSNYTTSSTHVYVTDIKSVPERELHCLP